MLLWVCSMVFWDFRLIQLKDLFIATFLGEFQAGRWLAAWLEFTGMNGKYIPSIKLLLGDMNFN